MMTEYVFNIATEASDNSGALANTVMTRSEFVNGLLRAIIKEGPQNGFTVR